MTDQPATVWEGCDADALAKRWGAPAVHPFRRVGSTNDVARALAAAGCEPGTVVIAEEQVAGRGRAGRAWSSPAGLGLWFSVVVTPLDGKAAAVLPLRIGLAVAQALDPSLPAEPVGIKWPNDLGVVGRKLGGILCEAAWEGTALRTLVAGVGLNVLHAESDFPPELRPRATSVRLAAGFAPRRLEVADRVIAAVVAEARRPEPLDVTAVARRDLLLGQSITVADPTTQRVIAEGVAAGILADGSLQVWNPSGIRAVRSGTVRLEAADST